MNGAATDPPIAIRELSADKLEKNLSLFNSELQTLLIQTQINMRKLTVNDVQLSDLTKTCVSEYRHDVDCSIAELHHIILNCQHMQDEFMQIEALQKKMYASLINGSQIFRILCEEILLKKERELAALP